jgi:hypothetical protein
VRESSVSARFADPAPFHAEDLGDLLDIEKAIGNESHDATFRRTVSISAMTFDQRGP